MLQDILCTKLENEYKKPLPCDSDFVFCFKDGRVLIKRAQDDSLSLPELNEFVQKENYDKLQYFFRFRERNCFWLDCDVEYCGNDGYSYETVRTLRQIQSKDVCFAVMTAWHLFVWYSSNRFCGRCGTGTVHDSVERMVRCPECGNMIYPRISPAVIVGVTNGNRLLLSKYAGRNYNRFALLAGYTEIGETLEQTVEREVMEEVGIKVKNIRYYKSQPWGVDGNVLVGYFCDLDGADTLRPDESELSYAGWYDRNSIPCEDDGISLTREMIRIFKEGKEPV